MTFSSIDWHRILGPDQLGLDSVEIKQLTQSLSQHSRRCIRLRSSQPSFPLPFDVETVPWNDRGRWLVDPNIRPGAFLHSAAGDYYIQDAASMLAITLCQAQPGQWVCDLCAAPGGKATGLLEQLAGSGLLLANDVIRSRLALLEFALCRAGWGNYLTTNRDVDRLAQELDGQFDCVLVDAPCSGQSMVGRSAQSMSAFSENQIELNAARQHRILNAASGLVNPGGRLVYSTCTFSIAENEQIVERFLNENPAWQLEEMPELTPWSSPRLPGSYRLWPHRDRCDGGFAAALVSPNSPASEPRTTAMRSQSGPRSHVNLPSRKRSTRNSKWQRWRGDLSELDWLQTDSAPQDVAASTLGFSAWHDSNSIHLFADEFPEATISLASSGYPIAKLHPSGRSEPSHASAVVTHPTLSPKQSVSLSDEQAIPFAAGESITLSDATLRPGWCRVDWNDRSLAWGKLVGGVLKNHWPKLLRIPNLIAR